MAQAKGLVWEESQEDGNQLSPTVLDSVARQPSQAAESLSDPVEPRCERDDNRVRNSCTTYNSNVSLFYFHLE
jgi:hypothetical protein